MNDTDTNETWVSLSEAARSFAVSRGTMKRLLAEAQTPVLGLKSQWRIKRSDLDALRADRLTTFAAAPSRDGKGFTLIELIVVIAVIGVLAAIAVPLYADHQQNARTKSVAASANAAYKSGLVALSTRGDASLAATEAALNGSSDRIGSRLIVNPRDAADVCAMSFWRDSTAGVPNAYYGDDCLESDWEVVPDGGDTGVDEEPEPVVTPPPPLDSHTFVTITSPTQTSQPSYQLAGAGEPNSALVVRRSGVVLATGAVNSSGAWTVQVDLVNGPNNLSVTATDASGNVATSSRVIVRVNP